MKTSLLILLFIAATCFAEPQPVPMTQALSEMDENWKITEPKLFQPDSDKKYIGEWIRCTGSTISLRNPITIKLDSGTTIRLTKLQGADKSELETFRKPPSKVTVRGPILAIDTITRTVTIKAVSTMFTQ